MSAYRVSAVPATIGLVLLGTAIYLQIEHSITSGHLTSTDALQPAITLAVAVAGVISHHRLATWRLVSGLLFAVLALIGSGVVVYSTLSRTATARDTAAASALAENRQLANLGDELTTARRDATVECKSGFGPRCSAAKARVDALVSGMNGLRSISADPRADAIAKLAVLLGLDGEHARQIASAVDPAIAPVFCEIACVLMLAAGFPHRNRPASVGKREESVAQVSVLSQRELARKWGVHESTVSRRLQAMEAAGKVQRRRKGRCKLALPAT